MRYPIQKHYLRRAIQRSIQSANDEGFLNLYLAPGTLHENSDGSGDVTTAGDPIGLIDNMLAALPAFSQSVDASRPLFASVPKTEVSNLLAYRNRASETFTNWTASAAIPTAGADGILALLSDTADNSAHTLNAPNDVRAISGRTFSFFVTGKKGTADYFQLATGAGGFDEANIFASINLDAGEAENTGSGGTYDVQPVPQSWIDDNPELEGCYGVMVRAVANASADSGMFIYLTNNTNAASRGITYIGDPAQNVYITRAMIVDGEWTLADYFAKYERVDSNALVTRAGVENIRAICFDGTADQATLSTGVFGTAVSGMFADAGNNWHALVAFIPTGARTSDVRPLLDQTGAVTQFRIEVGSGGDIRLVLRGTSTTIEIPANNGRINKWMVLSVDCNDGAVTWRINRLDRTAGVVGVGALAAADILFGARGPGSRWFIGYALPPRLSDESWSDVRELEAHNQLCDYLGIA